MYQIVESKHENKNKNTSRNETKTAPTVAYPPIVIEPFKSKYLLPRSRLASFELNYVWTGDTLAPWFKYPLHPSLLHFLHKRNFLEPTPIQKETLDVFFTGKSHAGERDLEDHTTGQSSSSQRDIVGIAQTVRVSTCSNLNL